MTNCDLKTNGERCITFCGLQKPSALAQLNASYAEPLATGGAIFCCPTNGPSVTAACLIGIPVGPSTMSYGFDGVRLVLQDVTFRTSPNCNISAINARYLSGLELHGTVVVDSGTATPYAAAPMSLARSPNTVETLAHSILSFSGVPVPWALI